MISVKTSLFLVKTFLLSSSALDLAACQGILGYVDKSAFLVLRSSHLCCDQVAACEKFVSNGQTELILKWMGKYTISGYATFT